MPTPCRPPDTLYPSWSNLPPAWSTVMTTSMAGLPSLAMTSTGMPRPSSSTDERAVGVDDDVDVLAVAGQRFVDRVVDGFEGDLMQPAHARVADVHARPFANAFETLEHTDLTSAVVGMRVSVAAGSGGFFGRLDRRARDSGRGGFAFLGCQSIWLSLITRKRLTHIKASLALSYLCFCCDGPAASRFTLCRSSKSAAAQSRPSTSATTAGPSSLCGKRASNMT